MFEDDELKWMADLDWSAHGHQQLGHVTPDGYLPLAQAFLQLAKMAVDDWPTHPPKPYFLMCASLRPKGEYPNAEFAFDRHGRPLTSIHDAYAVQVREDAARYMVPIRSRRSISRAEWDAVEDAVAEDWAWGVGARRVWSTLATALATAASKREVKTGIRPIIRGGSIAPLKASSWLIDQRRTILRAASCGIYIDPIDGTFDDAKPPNHSIFVDKFRLVPTLEEIARENYATHIDISEIGRLPRPIDDTVTPERKLLEHLIQMMKVSDPLETSRDDLREELNRAFGMTVGPRPFKRIWADAKSSDKKLEDYGRTGPKRAKTRPVG